ncbi:hypothetical protein NV379_11065 [Paenibacillus sp. N1-5-1-14]|uniref:hypothetical protein n=1 Tax=Paenibacillus radicibacter TaxID=2972488 RepID=UPI00215971D0|nr:hypothetical protein [Paenibacillus radicibacter]MCR8643200.1 hypothetical protein [Paenibacillus radicibacter]
MSQKEMEQQLRQNYERDERMMALVFAQWCVNHDLDPIEVYRKAYPNQETSPALIEMLELTVPKEEAGEVAHDTLLGVLSLFDNSDLAAVVTEEMQTLRNKK